MVSTWEELNMAGRYEKLFCISKYYEDENLRIFSMVNIQENENLFKTGCIRNTDKFLILLCWLHDEKWFSESYNILKLYQLNPDNFYILCNTQLQTDTAINVGFKNSYFINRHFNLDYNYYSIDTECKKEFDACIFGEQLNRNRIPMTFGVKSLAIIDGNAAWNSEWNYPSDAWRNTGVLGTNGKLIQETMRKSWCGICISQAESMCWSSLEFFYNGIPVITTYNDTGRMEWYNDKNSIIISEEELENNLQNVVNDFVSNIKSGKYDPYIIRKQAIEE